MSAPSLDRWLRSPSALVCLALLVSSLGVANHELWTPDEPRDAAIGLEMWRTGSWWVPRLSGVPFLEKPPLYWWAQSVSYALVGQSAGAARLPSAAFGFASVLLTLGLARRFFSSEVSVLSGLVLLSTWLFVHHSHWITVDPALLFGVTGALTCFTRAERSRGLRRILLLLALDAFLAVSFFSKGVVGIGIPVLGITGYLFWRRRVREFAGPLALGMSLTAFLGAAWLCAVGREVGTTGVLEFLLHNQVARFFPRSMGYAGGHQRPVYYYLLQAPLQFLPWTPIVALAAVAATRRWRQLGQEERAGLALGVSAVVPALLFLSLAGTKRGVYLLPLAPPLAMLAAWWIALREPRSEWEQRIETSWRRTLLALCALLPSLPVLLGEASPLGPIATVVLAGLALASERRAAEDRTGQWTRALILVNAAWACLLAVGPPALDRFKNLEPLARGIDQAVPGGATLHALRPSETLRGLLSFYTHRSTEIVPGLPALSVLAKRQRGAWVGVEMGRPANGLSSLHEASVPFILHETVEKDGRGAWIIELDAADRPDAAESPLHAH